MSDKFTVTQIDLLKEIGTIGSATAATSLAEMVQSRVEITVPQVSLIPIENIANIMEGPDRLYFVLDMEIKGDIDGRIFFLLPPDNAKFLGGVLLGKAPAEVDLNDDLFKSSLREVCNILGGSYVSALANMTSMTIFISIPSLALDMVGAILDFIFIQIAQDAEEALIIRTDMKVKDTNLEGLFLLFPTVDSLKKIFSILNVT
ncbi:MAG TPA: chemotaxis protein CheC [Candidatus Omnitrophota bacterium]|jgi:chemotaxis protein CheC|nr:chemotaxis protein CheC [Candidatus Omnitrophota bacterium]